MFVAPNFDASFVVESVVVVQNLFALGGSSFAVSCLDALVGFDEEAMFAHVDHFEFSFRHVLFRHNGNFVVVENACQKFFIRF